MKPLVSKRVRTTENFSLTINGETLREMINEELKASGADHLLPPDAAIYVRVPGGGDWSNEDLDIESHPIEVRWTVESGEDL